MAAIHHAVPGPGFPATNPRHVPEASESVRFDEALHLALEGPRYIKTLDGGEAQFPVPMGQGGTFQGLAYSAPFRLLSEEGVKALRGVLLENEKFSTMVPGRIPKCIRGIGYRSKFMRDLGYSPRILAHLSRCAGEPITPHGMCSNLSQINFGEIGAGVKVDQWHLDSVPYVMVLLMSDGYGGRGIAGGANSRGSTARAPGGAGRRGRCAVH